METKTEWKKMNRQERGREILKTLRIAKTPYGWRVPSQSPAGHSYLVKFNRHEPECDCNDCQLRKEKCKHIHAVEFFIKKQIDNKGKITQTKGIKVTYGQEWSAYNKSQTNEKIVLMRLLKDLCSHIEQPEYKFGRPTLPFSDMVFGSAMKVYTTFSLRRFISDMKIAKEFDLVDKVPCYSSISNFMNRKELTPILKQLIQLSAMPLKEVEVDFAVDSSGFSTSRFGRWFDYKWGKEQKYRIWLKAHLCSGVKTNIISSVEISEGREHDTKRFSNLINETAKQFNIKEVSGDMAYSNKKNLELVEEVGAIPYIPFKKNVTGKHATSVWRKMYHYFIYKHDEFLKHYHKRSNSETVFHMIKTKFKDNVRSKKKTAQINELLLKVLCHNICVVIQEINELNVKGEFIVEEKISV